MGGAGFAGTADQPGFGPGDDHPDLLAGETLVFSRRGSIGGLQSGSVPGRYSLEWPGTDVCPLAAPGFVGPLVYVGQSL